MQNQSLIFFYIAILSQAKLVRLFPDKQKKNIILKYKSLLWKEMIRSSVVSCLIRPRKLKRSKLTLQIAKKLIQP